MPQAPLYTTAEDLFTSRLMCGCSQHSATTNECVECTILQSCAGQPSCCHHICLQSAWRLQVYLDEEDKPEVGEGLNRAAEVTLHKVFKLDRATNRPSTAPADIEKYERKLKRLAASQSARFVSYNGRTGTWVFEVEHFSRQALHRACAWRSVSLRTDWLTGNACLPPEPIIKMSSPYEAPRVSLIFATLRCAGACQGKAVSQIWSADCQGQHAGMGCLMTRMRTRHPASRLQEAETSLNHQQAPPGRSLKRRACSSVRLLASCNKRLEVVYEAARSDGDSRKIMSKA